MKVSKIKMAILGACLVPLIPSVGLAEEVKEAHRQRMQPNDLIG